ncbi:DUF2516 family protein [Georgenia sp. SYP-B2076]|uniref:DUF2516 family protein n=1 Tax=Georgenia sp. SYP-B2076 TaxID=2495881 RepID=UPI000F8E8832|nr:DUF2516 family protein [Georgenia sp. SYP-B2076]
MLLVTLQQYLMLGLSLVLFGVEAWALIDAARRPAAAFLAAGKRTKNFWLILTGVAAAVGFIGIGGIGFLQFVAVVPAGVYLADVRPAVSGYGGGRGGRRPPRSGSGW